MPIRIQRKLTKGWRMPAGAVYVGRPTTWGNPFLVDPVASYEAALLGQYKREVDILEAHLSRWSGIFPDMHQTVQSFRKLIVVYLRGRDLACWCPLDRSCHADVLLELANK